VFAQHVDVANFEPLRDGCVDDPDARVRGRHVHVEVLEDEPAAGIVVGAEPEQFVLAVLDVVVIGGHQRGAVAVHAEVVEAGHPELPVHVVAPRREVQQRPVLQAVVVAESLQCARDRLRPGVVDALVRHVDDPVERVADP
jgi:hypothetical protein